MNAADLPSGSGREYASVHHAARKLLSGKPCGHCGTIGRIDAALSPDTDGSRLRTDPQTGCRYSTDPADYLPLCRACHFKMDAEGRETCAKGHERTPGNTSYKPDGSRRCLACHRENERARLADPAARERKNAAQRRRPLNPAQQARKTELQRRRRAEQRMA